MKTAIVEKQTAVFLFQYFKDWKDLICRQFAERAEL